MSSGYQAVGWNRQKRLYDLVLAAGIVLYLTTFAGVTLLLHPTATAESILIRGFGSAALLLLHVALAIGPLARLDPRFVPLLYNRRHLGVTTFLLGLAHGALATFQYHALGDQPALVSLLSSTRRWGSPGDWPFELFGIAALMILFVMAATSHDAWLAQLTAPVWKRLHMAVYPAYVLLLVHVGLGALQDETSLALAACLALGVALLAALHLLAGWREHAGDRELAALAKRKNADDADGSASWVDVGLAHTIPEGRARTVALAGERVAVFRYDGKISAVSNVCRHQNGPLGEGRILDGCITCPWHGYQYRPESGASPPPFRETVPTFRVRVVGDRVEVDPRPLPAGTHVEPARFAAPGPTAVPASARDSGPDTTPLYVGYLPAAPPSVARFMQRVVVAMLLAAGGLAALVAAAQQTYAPSRFEFGKLRTLEGTIWEQPLALFVVDPGALATQPDLLPATSPGAVETWLLVGPGKHGASGLISGLEGRRVRLTGTLAERRGQRIFELSGNGITSLEPTSPRASRAAATGAGEVELVGEIVDGKCFLGVMNPGSGKTHRGCAVRCISGGAPALLAVRDSHGALTTMPLVALAEPLLPALLELVAEPVRVRGELRRVTPGMTVLAVRPDGIERLSRRSP